MKAIFGELWAVAVWVVMTFSHKTAELFTEKLPVYMFLLSFGVFTLNTMMP
jgi:hypothetical protein